MFSGRQLHRVPFIIHLSAGILFVLTQPFTNTKLLDGKKKCLLPRSIFEIHGAYINKFACVYSVSLLITWIQWYFQDETSHKFGLTSREALCMRRKCVHIMSSLPLYIAEGSLPRGRRGIRERCLQSPIPPLPS